MDHHCRQEAARATQATLARYRADNPSISSLHPYQTHDLSWSAQSLVSLQALTDCLSDGGLKRFRVYGHPFANTNGKSSALKALPSAQVPIIAALPLTPEAFKPYGQVIQGFSLPTSAPKGIHVTTANQGTAMKFHRMANITDTYPSVLLKRGGTYIACTHAEMRMSTGTGISKEVKVLERRVNPLS